MKILMQVRWILFSQIKTTLKNWICLDQGGLSKLALSGLALGLFGFSHLGQAQSNIYINVGQAKVKKSLVALPPLLYFGSQTKNRKHLQAGTVMYQTILNDLTTSALFTFIRPEAYLEDPTKKGLKPAPGAPNGFSFGSWKQIGTEFLIRGGYTVTGSRLSLEIYLYHVKQAKLILGKKYIGTLKAPRKLGHTFSNDALRALTGKAGSFLSKVTASYSKKGSSIKEIIVMDWDGKNRESITNHKSIAVSPSWSRDGQTIAYSAFAFHKKAKRRNLDLFTFNRRTKKRLLVSYRPGNNLGASFFPGGKELLITLSKTGGADIFRMTADGKKLRQLTKGPNGAMNVEAALSPDGKKIAFSSDRAGRPMIYTMNVNGTGVKRITFAGKYNASPTWSPDGKQLAFAGHDKGHFDIFLINVDGTGLKRLTSAKKRNGKSANNEDPSFSPDGRLIMFSSNRDGNRQLYVVNKDGTDERRITLDSHSYEKPHWGPEVD